MIRMSVPLSRRCVAKLWRKRVQRDALGQPRRLDRRPAGRMQDRRVDRMIIVAAGEQERLRPGEAPIGAQDAEQLRRQHHVAVLPALAVTHQDHAAGAVDVRLPPTRLRSASPSCPPAAERGRPS